ncbi:MAG: endonuclease [Verrucomicrobia bacterium]|nr:endonuclease [Verrucomicrobiota bacterium]
MTPHELEALLAETLDDCRLSSGEKRALAQVIADAKLDNHRRNVARNRAFALAREALADISAREVLQWLEDVNKLLLPRADREERSASEACFTPGPDCARRIIGLLSNARHAADLCVFTIADNVIADAILAAHRRGVRVRIISDDQKARDAGSDIDRFRRSGTEVRLDQSPDHMHHKFALFDKATLVTGSFNWTRSASDYNQENIIVTGDERLVKAFGVEFERLWNAL